MRTFLTVALPIVAGLGAAILWVLLVIAANDHGLIQLNAICSGPDYLAFLASIPVVAGIAGWLTFRFLRKRLFDSKRRPSP